MQESWWVFVYVTALTLPFHHWVPYPPVSHSVSNSPFSLLARSECSSYLFPLLYLLNSSFSFQSQLQAGSPPKETCLLPYTLESRNQGQLPWFYVMEPRCFFSKPILGLLCIHTDELVSIWVFHYMRNTPRTSASCFSSSLYSWLLSTMPSVAGTQ